MTTDLSFRASPVPPELGRVSGPYLLPLLEAARRRGIDAAQLARAAGWPLTRLEPLPEWLPAQDYVHLLQCAAQAAGDPHFGLHVGECVKLGTYNVYGLILLSCRDFGQALAQTLRYEGLAHDLGRSAITFEGEWAYYRWHTAFPEASRHLVESVYAGIRVFGDWLAGTRLPAAELALPHIPEGDPQEYLRVLGTLPRHDGNGPYARFPRALLDWPVPNADATLFPVLRQHAEQLLREKEELHAHDLPARVRTALTRALTHDQARLPDVAEALGMSPRTLQRKLREAGTPFQSLLDQTRQTLACTYLREERMSLTDIAFLLGYQEQSSFNHAFRAWTGYSPSAWREAHKHR